MHNPLHILIDGRMISNTGIGRLLQNMVFHVQQLDANHRLTVLVNSDSQAVRGFSLPTKPLFFSAPIYSIREQLSLPLELVAAHPDVAHYPNFNVPLATWTRSVVTLCDLIYYLFPAACPSWTAHYYARFMMHTVARRARKIVTISEYSKGDLVNYLGVCEDKITVIYPAVNRSIFKPQQSMNALAALKGKLGIDRPYIFYTGNHDPRKNLETLFRAYRKLARQKDFQLVIGGHLDSRRTALYNEISDLRATKDVLLCGSIPESDLALMYTGAELFVFPSRYEGFGLPPLEALACGVPVVCSSAASLPEVVGDAALFFSPEKVEELTSVMEAVLTSPTLTADLRAKGLARASRFSWEIAARQMLQVYKEVASC